MEIDWESDKTYLFLNPRMPEEKKISLADLPHLPGHLWVATSGSESMKYVALSKRALLTSAEQVNRHLNIQKEDAWIHVLPDFHVGGIGIWARSYLSGSKVCKIPTWSPDLFRYKAEEQKATLASLVPAQVFDLVRSNCKAPKSLRAIFVGGASLSETLYRKAKELHWPLVPTYGMTECASQIATASPQDPTLQVLPHIELRVNDKGCIQIKSPSLFSGYAIQRDNGIEFLDPKEGGWFRSEDRGSYAPPALTIVGRSKDFVKIGGESVNLEGLNKILKEIMHSVLWPHSATIVAIEDERLENTIQLITTSKFSDTLIESFNMAVSPYEKIRSVRYVERIPSKLV